MAPGEVRRVSDELAAYLLQAGYAEEVVQDETKRADRGNGKTARQKRAG